MKYTLRYVLIVVALVANVPVFADNLYTGFTISQVTVKSNSGEVKPYIGTVKVGYQFARSFALEGQFAGGVKDDKNGATTFEVDKMTGVFLRIGGSSDYNGVRLYLLAGHTTTELKTDPVGGGETEFKGSAWGIGAEEFSRSIKNMAYVFEYIRLYDDDDAEITGISLGVRYNF